MIDFALLITLLVLAVRAFVTLRRESAVRREFGQSSLLDGLVLLYPLGPVAMLIGSRFVPQALLFACVGALFIAALFVASKQRNALECAGTDRVKGALAATSSATLGAIVGVIYVGLAGAFAFIGHAISSQPLGA
jgi:hypothetical protein